MKTKMTFKKTNLLSLTILTIVACGRPNDLLNQSEIRNSFQTKLKLGRNVLITSSESSADMNLDSNVVRQKQDKFNGTVISMEFDTNNSEALRSEELNSNALSTIDSFRDKLNVDSNELVTLKSSQNQIDDKIAFFHFQRHINDLPVKNAFIDVIYTKDSSGLWRLAEISNNTYAPRSLLTTTRSPVDENFLKAAFETEGFEVSTQSEIIFPKSLFSGDVELHQANVFHVLSGKDLQYVVTVSQHSHEILESYSPRMSAVNTIQAPGFPRSYMDGAQPFVMPDVQVTIGGKLSRTSLLGELAVPAQTQANIRLYSDRVDIMKTFQTITFDLTLAPGKPLAITNELNKRGVNAFLSVHRVNQFVRQYLLDTQTRVLKAQMNVFLDVSPGDCNAFYTNTSINLYSAGSGCANMANVNDVIYHEWGHGLDDYTGRQVGITDDALSEAIGDVTSAYLTASPNMATGFFTNKVQGIRQLQNNAKYPADVDSEDPHMTGLIIGGTFWDLRTALIARYGESKGTYLASHYFFKHLLTTDSYLESYQAILRLDDNDGNPATQSPNHCLITEAFAKHGLATANSGCVDNFDGSQSSPSIALGLTASSFEGSSLMIAVDRQASVFVCSDSKEKCLAEGATLTPATLDGAIGSKVGYVVSKYPRLTEQQMITVIVKDGDKVVGNRSFKLMKR